MKTEKQSRITNEIQSISYESTKKFFDRRAGKYNDSNPYSVTMYQDNNADLVAMRNEYEVRKLTEKLNLNAESRVLDLACGIGRWADALNDKVDSYLGIDFSEELIKIAKQRNCKSNVSFAVGSVTNLHSVLNKSETFNVILMIGIMVYLNEEDLLSLMEQVEQHCDHKATVCIREPIGLQNRLTLKEFYSDELKDNYNAIYRTKDELLKLFASTLMHNGFSVVESDYLFDNDCLNNRKETAQYYFILQRT